MDFRSTGTYLLSKCSWKFVRKKNYIITSKSEFWHENLDLRETNRTVKHCGKIVRTMQLILLRLRAIEPWAISMRTFHSNSGRKFFLFFFFFPGSKTNLSGSLLMRYLGKTCSCLLLTVTPWRVTWNCTSPPPAPWARCGVQTIQLIFQNIACKRH